MELQPVALAIIALSPKSEERSLRYGVSPHPAHAPENSKRGRRSCTSLTVEVLSLFLSASGISRKKFQLSRSGRRTSIWFTITRGLLSVPSLALTGQLWAQSPQPVQSSGAICTVYLAPSKFFHLASAALKVSGASARSSGSYILARIAAWGQTREHLPHWMQSAGSHEGMSMAMLRFSYCVVALGNVPSSLMADTGRLSPSSIIMGPSMSLTNSGASSATGGSMSNVLVASAGTVTW